MIHKILVWIIISSSISIYSCSQEKNREKAIDHDASQLTEPMDGTATTIDTAVIPVDSVIAPVDTVPRTGTN